HGDEGSGSHQGAPRSAARANALSSLANRSDGSGPTAGDSHMIARRFALATLVAAGAIAVAGCGMMDRDKGGAGVMSIPLSGQHGVPAHKSNSDGTARL